MPVSNRKLPWLMLALTAFVSGMALVVTRLRQSIMLPAQAADPVMADSVSVSMSIPAVNPPALPKHPLSARPVRWFLFLCGVGTLGLVLTTLQRPAALFILALAIIGAGLGALDRAGRLRPILHSAQQVWSTPRGRWLTFTTLAALLIVTLLLLPRSYATLVFSGLALLGGGVLSYRAAMWARDVPLTALEKRGVQRAAFAAVAALLLWVLFTLDAPYDTLLLLSLCAGGLLTGVTQRQAGLTARGEQIAVMRGAALAAVLLAMTATYAFHTISENQQRDAGLLLIVAASTMVMAGSLSGRAGAGASLMQPAAEALSPAALSRRNYRIAGVGLALLVVMAEANGRALKIPLLVQMSPHVQFLLLVFGCALLVIGFGGVTRWPRIKFAWGTVGLLALITGAAFFLRFWQLEYALRMFVDEMNFASVVRDFWNTPNVPLLEPMSSIAAFPYLFPYWQAHTVELFGRNLIGLRAASAVVGTLTIPAVYLLGRAAFDRKTALIAALLLATFPPHLHFSRLGLNNIADPLFGTLALAFVMRGLAHNRRVDYAIGGVMLGLTHYFYEGGRFLFTPVMLIWLGGLVYFWRLRWRDLLTMGLLALIAAIPIYYTLYAIDRPVAARMVDNGTALSSEYWLSLLRGDTDLRTHTEMRVVFPFMLYIRAVEGSLFYKGEQGFIMPALVPLFFLGIGYALARLRRPGPLLLILWVLATNMGNMLMVAADHSPRYVLVFPALMLLVAVGIRYTLAMLWPTEGRARLRTLLLALLVAGFAGYQAHYYFNGHLPLYNHQTRSSFPHRDGQDAVFRSLQFPPRTQVFIISEVPPDLNYTAGVLRFYREDLFMDSIEPDVVTRDWIAERERGVDHAFFVEPGHDDILKLLGFYYYLLPPQYSPYDDLPEYFQFPLYYAPYLPGFSDEQLARLNRSQQRRFPMRTP